MHFTKLNLVERNITVNDKLIKTIGLKNGLTLEIYDHSRKIAGDRWYLKMVARIDIPIDLPSLGDGLSEHVTFNALKEAFDNRIRYEQSRERNFIAKKEKDTVFNDLMNSYLTSTRQYLSHPNFAMRYAVKEYLKLQQQKTWYQERNKS